MVNKYRNGAELEEFSKLDELHYLDMAIARGNHERFTHQKDIRNHFLRYVVLGEPILVFIPEAELTILREKYTSSNYCVLVLKIQSLSLISEIELSLKNVAQVFGLSTTYVGKIFKSIQGESYASFIMNYRLEQTKRELVETTKAVNEIAMEFGFTNSAYYATVFKNIYGMIPAAYRNKI